MKKYLKGFILFYRGSHVVFYTPVWFTVYQWLAGRHALYVSPDATPNKALIYIGSAQHGVHLTAYRRGYAVVSFIVVALLAFVFYKIGGR